MGLIDVFMTRCDCLTKTPVVEFHKEDCKFRLAWENCSTKRDEVDAELDALIGKNISDLYEE